MTQQPEVSVSLAYDRWERVLFFLDCDAREGTHSAAMSRKLADDIRAQIPPGPVTMDPVAAAERALSFIPSRSSLPMDPAQLKEALKELAHGLAACERRRRAE